MNLILFTLIALFLYIPSSQAAIEVYLGIKHFNSFEDYQKVREGVAVVPAKVAVATPKSSEEPALSPKEKSLMNEIAYDTGINHVVVDFSQNWKNPKPRFIIGADELEYSIRQTLEKGHEPAILISEPGKMRIMTFDFKKVASLSHKIQSVDKTTQKLDNKL